MLELLVKYKNKVNFKDIEEWTYSGGFERYQNVDESFSLHKIVNTSGYKVITNNLLKLTSNYKITFDLDIVYGQMRLKSGGLASQWYTTDGSYTFTGALQTILTIESLDDGDEWYLSNLVIEEIEYTSLDLYENPDILINFNIADVRDYSKRMGDYTKDIKIPGTPKNNKFFDYIYDENIQSRLGFLTKCEAVIAKGGHTIVTGNIFLNEVIKNKSLDEYTLQFFAQQLNLFKDIGEDLLETLDFSSLNHTLTVPNIIDSWNNFPATSDYVYPWIDYGRDWGIGGEYGRLIDSTPSVGITPHDFIPAIGVKPVIDKIFSTYGYTVSSALFDSAQFKKLMIPFTNSFEELKQEWHTVSYAEFTGGPTNITNGLCEDFEILGQDAWGNIGSNHLQDWIDGYFTGNIKSTMTDGVPSYYYVSGYTPHIMDATTELYRRFNYGPFMFSNLTNCPLGNTVGNLPGGYCTTPNPKGYQVNPNHIPGSFLVSHKGRYRISCRYRITQNDHSATVNGLKGFRIWASKARQADIITDNVSFGSVQYAYTENKWSFVDGATDQPVPIGGDNGFPGYHEGTVGFTTGSAQFDCEAGDELFIKFRGNSAIIRGNIVWIKVEELGYGQGITQDMNQILPKEVKIIDFLKDLIQMFNLYIDVDPDNSNNLIIDPRDIFFSGGTILDWSQKLDLNYDISMLRPTDYQSLLNRFKFADGDDYANKRYNEEKDVRKIGYGGKRFVFENDVIDGEKDVKLSVFAPTIINDIYGINGDGNKPQFVVSNLWNATYPRTNPINYTYKTKWKPRILYFNNLTIPFNTVTQRKFNFNGSTTHSNAAKYPYAGHILNPFDLSGSTNYDINYETPIVTGNVYQKQFTGYPSNYMTNNNLWNLYHLNQYEQLTNKDSKLLTAYFNLTVNDIIDLKLSDIIQLNSNYYYINRIVDFNPLEESSTKVELLRVLLTPDISFTASQDSDIFPNIPVNINDVADISLSTNVEPAGGEVIILGEQNIVSSPASRSILSNSDFNMVRSPSTIINSNFITVGDNLSGATVINETKMKVNEDAVYIDKLKIKNGFIMENNDVVDGGYIEDDGILNPYLYKGSHINDQNFPISDFPIDANIIEDGGLI